MKIALSNQVTLTDAPRSLVKAVKTRSTFPNPAFTEAERRGRWTGDLERTLAYYCELPDGSLQVPRGYARNKQIFITDGGEL